MYDAAEMYRHMDHHKLGILLVGGVSIIFIWLWFGSALRISTKERVYSTPIFIVLFWFAHDFSEIAQFPHWFNDFHGAWFPKLLTVQFTGTVIFELLYTRQIIRYGRKEHAPSLTQKQWTALVIIGLAFTFGVWKVIKVAYADPGYIWGTAMTLVLYPPFAIGLAMRRRSSAGQTREMWVGFLGCCVFWWGASIAWFGGPCRDFGYIALGILSVLGGLVMLYLVEVLPRTEGETATRRPWLASGAGQSRARPASGAVEPVA
jgi:hypothetical protein